MRFRFSLPLIAALAALTLVSRPAPAQEGPPRDIVASMPAIAQSLGVTCNYCHLSRRGVRVPEPRKDIARAMIAMTREINLKVQAATGKAPDEATQVQCVTCHRGVAIPGQLTDILMKTVADKGVDSAVAQYRELHSLYYGRQSYDFGEDTLLAVAQRVLYRDPDEAIAILQLNLETYPKSVKTYSLLATASSRKLDDKTAIADLEKALEIDPSNSVIKGQLAQLKSYRRNR